MFYKNPWEEIQRLLWLLIVHQVNIMRVKLFQLFVLEIGKNLYFFFLTFYRAKNIQNKAKVNAERSVAELKILLAKAEKENNRLSTLVGALTEELQVIRSGGTISKSVLDGNKDVVNNLPNVAKIQGLNS